MSIENREASGLKRLRAKGWKRRVLGLLIVTVVWLVLWFTPAGEFLDHVSYDLPFLAKPGTPVQDVVILYIDEASLRKLKQEPKSWDRALHARLLDRLTAERAALVVFDVFFADAGTPNSNRELARAIWDNGRVVLAAQLAPDVHSAMRSVTLEKPREDFLSAAAAFGIAGVTGENAAGVRNCFPNSVWGPSLAWAAAHMAGARLPLEAEPRWLNYYGSSGAIPGLRYCDYSSQPNGFFRNKVVFVGARPKTPYIFDEVEEFRTPHTLWNGQWMPGVEIMATEYRNLVHGDWLRRVPPWGELALLLLTGGAIGLALVRLRPVPVVVCGLTGIAFVVAAACLLILWQHLWFSWATIALVQIPCAASCAIFAGLRAPAAAADVPKDIPVIPDHTLVRCIGQGSYGEVWLAKNTINLPRAVKIIRRDSFEDNEPYEREYSGIQRYMPISLSSPGLLHVLHLGRREEQGYFFYIMELADDETSSPTFDPDRYRPRTLASEIKRRRSLPVQECIQLGIDLSEALETLHQNHLIHRDIKPANIIYVSGKPKLADIGTVTRQSTTGKTVSNLGTFGYMSPEGAGTAAGDLYSLGIVLYEACFGRKPPDIRTALLDAEDDGRLREMNKLLNQACEHDPKARFQSARELQAALAKLRRRLGPSPPQSV